MHFEGKVRIKAPKEKVFNFLVNPKSISECIPDVQELEILDKNRFRITVKVGMSFIKGTYKFDVSLEDLRPPTHGKLKAKGYATGTGIEVETSMDLIETEEGVTDMVWKADATVSGLLASIGSRFIKGAVEKIVSQIFECVKSKLEV